MLFGVLYALGVIALYAALDRAAVPTFYDKLLAVPVMNLLVQAIDRLARANVSRRFAPAAPAGGVTGRRRNLAWAGAWAAVFAAMSAAQGVGDHHRGQWVPFWQRACAEGRPHACRNLGNLVSNYCRVRSGWACNEFGILLDPRRNPQFAARAFGDACELGFQPGWRQPRPEHVERPAPSAARRRRLPHHPAGRERTAAGADLRRAVPTGVPAGIRRRLPARRPRAGCAWAAGVTRRPRQSGLGWQEQRPDRRLLALFDGVDVFELGHGAG